MTTNDDYEPSYPGPEERLQDILAEIYFWDGGYDRDGILDIIHSIFEDGYQEGYAQGQRDDEAGVRL